MKNLYSLHPSDYHTLYSLPSLHMSLILSLTTLLIITVILLSLIDHPTVSAQAVAIKSDNVTKLLPIKYIPFGSNANISVKSNGVGRTAGVSVEADIGDNPAGLSSYNIFKGKFISIFLGNVSKTSNDLKRGEPQISFKFDIDAAQGEYHLIIVNGRLSETGWVNNVYYDKIQPNSYKLFNLPELFNSKGFNYKDLKRIAITFEKQQKINKLEFNIALFQDSTPPSRISR